MSKGQVDRGDLRERAEDSQPHIILGVMSDTHGNRVLMHRVARLMTGTFGVQVIFHLGDDYADAEELSCSYDVRKVPGLWCPEYHDRRIPKRIVEGFNGVTVAAAHADKDLRSKEYAADILLTGHTHEARIEAIANRLHVNPGHLKAEKSRGERASFAVISVGPADVCARIHELDGSVRKQTVKAHSRQVL